MSAPGGEGARTVRRGRALGGRLAAGWSARTSGHAALRAATRARLRRHQHMSRATSARAASICACVTGRTSVSCSSRLSKSARACFSAGWETGTRSRSTVISQSNNTTASDRQRVTCTEGSAGSIGRSCTPVTTRECHRCSARSCRDPFGSHRACQQRRVAPKPDRSARPAVLQPVGPPLVAIGFSAARRPHGLTVCPRRVALARCSIAF